MARPHPTTARRAVLSTLAAGLLAGGAAGEGRAQPVAFDGSELRLSTGLVSDTQTPGLAPGPDGGFFAVWFGALPEGDSGAHYRGFDAGGAPLAEARRVPSRTRFFGPDGGRPVTAGDPSAGFAILQWTSRGNDTILESVLYRPSGDLRSGPLELGEPVADRQPAAAALGGPAPHLVVVRGQDDADQAFSPSRLLVRRFTASGAAAGGELQVSGEVAELHDAAVAVAAGGGFAVAWTENEEDGPRRLLVRLFDVTDAPVGAAVPVSPFPGTFSGAALSPGPGDGLTAWFLARPPGEEDLTLWRREIGPDGLPRGGATAVVSGLGRFVTDRPAAAADPEGNALVVWSAQGALDTRTEVFARAYGPEGVPAGPPFRVNTGVAGAQEAPAVVATGPNRFVVAWRSEEDFDAPTEIHGQLLRVDPGRPVAAERPPVALSPDRVACDEARLRGLLERLSVAARGSDPPAPPGVVLSFTRSGDFAGVAYTDLGGGGGAESQLTFSTNPEETPLLRNPERLPLASVSLSRNPPSSNLVPAGTPGELRLVLDPTLPGGPVQNQQGLLVIDNVDGAAGTPASARPGRGLGPVITPCHDLFAADDVQVFRVLQKVLRAGAPGAATVEIAAYRGEEPGIFRIDVYPLGPRGESLGRLAAELVVEWTPDGQLWTGEIRLLPRCGDGLVRGCTSVARPAVLELVEPTFGAPEGPAPARVRLEASSGVDPPVTRRFAWRELLAGSTWLGTP